MVDDERSDPSLESPIPGSGGRFNSEWMKPTWPTVAAVIPITRNLRRALSRLPNHPTQREIRRAAFTYDGRPRFTGVHS